MKACHRLIADSWSRHQDFLNVLYSEGAQVAGSGFIQQYASVSLVNSQKRGLIPQCCEFPSQFQRLRESSRNSRLAGVTGHRMLPLLAVKEPKGQ